MVVVVESVEREREQEVSEQASCCINFEKLSNTDTAYFCTRTGLEEGRYKVQLRSDLQSAWNLVTVCSEQRLQLTRCT